MMVPNFRLANFDKMRQDSSKVNWIKLLDTDTVDKKWTNFKDKVLFLERENIPKTLKRKGENNKSGWLGTRHDRNLIPLCIILWFHIEAIFELHLKQKKANSEAYLYFKDKMDFRKGEDDWNVRSGDEQPTSSRRFSDEIVYNGNSDVLFNEFSSTQYSSSSDLLHPDDMAIIMHDTLQCDDDHDDDEHDDDQSLLLSLLKFTKWNTLEELDDLPAGESLHEENSFKHNNQPTEKKEVDKKQKSFSPEDKKEVKNTDSTDEINVMNKKKRTREQESSSTTCDQAEKERPPPKKQCLEILNEDKGSQPT